MKISQIKRVSGKISKVTRLVILILFSLATFSFAYEYGLKSDWNEYKSDHFIIYYHPNITSRYIREFTRKCEYYYRLIAERLGFKRFDFWSWENRARVFVYDSRQDFVSDKNRSEWTAASVQIQQKLISTYYFAEDFFDKYLPHELTHIVLREVVGPKASLPLWFEEGVASANEEGCYLRYLLVAKGYADRQELWSIAKLEQRDKDILQSPKKFYAISASVVIFLLDDYSKNDFVSFCRELRDGNAFYQAMDKVYRIKNSEDLNDKFIAFLNKKGYEEIVTAAESTSANW